MLYINARFVKTVYILDVMIKQPVQCIRGKVNILLATEHFCGLVTSLKQNDIIYDQFATSVQ